jgi:hypothetical protein
MPPAFTGSSPNEIATILAGLKVKDQQNTVK